MEYKDINDFEVLYLIEENQSDLKEVIFEKYKPILKKLASLYYEKIKELGVEYEDVYQEALIGLNYAIDHFNGNKNNLFYTYAVLCIKSKLKTFAKQIDSNKHKLLNESIHLGKYDEIDIENIGYSNYSLEYLEFYNRIIHFKNSLNDTQAQIFELKYNGFSNKDIGALLGINVKNVYYHLCSVRNKLLISGFRL